jgi:mono/diheme cytochrome c family protein
MKTCGWPLAIVDLKGRGPASAVVLAAGSVAGLIAILLYAPATVAQGSDRVTAGLATWKTAGCVDCHGPFADGDRDDDDYPIGANLRTTKLGAADIKMTIRCGRPGTGMPSFDENAYTMQGCYGRPLGARPSNLQPTPRTLSPEEIDLLIAYLRARIVGRGRITREECLSYYDGQTDTCQDYK